VRDPFGTIWPWLPRAQRTGHARPTNSDVSLVRVGPLDPAGLLRELYPTGQRGHARVYPSDDYVQAAVALVAQHLGRENAIYLADGYQAATALHV
jgi:hypothetical protein